MYESLFCFFWNTSFFFFFVKIEYYFFLMVPLDRWMSTFYAENRDQYVSTIKFEDMLNMSNSSFALYVRQVYYVYGFMLLVFLILIIVTVCVTIVGTYFLLNAENYHWRWTSFFSAASTAAYVYLYSIYYYYVKTKMSGFFQTSFYFGYTLMFCLGLGILCGEFFFFFFTNLLNFK